MGSRAVRCTRRVGGGALVAVLAIVLPGCAVSTPEGSDPVPTATTRAVVPDGGVSLAELGFQHGPAALVTVPAGVRVRQAVDQRNVVTAVFASSDGGEIAPWLEDHLPAAGFNVSTVQSDAVLFTGHGWAGAFTVGEGESALTLRREVA